MDYEKAYKKAVEKLRYKISDNDGNIDYNEVVNVYELQDIFPGLAETEDEKWRKWLINHLKGYINQTNERYGEVCKEAITWIEKQGETSPVLSNSLNIGKRKIKGNEEKISLKLSKEDEEEFKIAIETLYEAGQHSSAMWLKSLKQRLEQQ